MVLQQKKLSLIQLLSTLCICGRRLTCVRCETRKTKKRPKLADVLCGCVYSGWAAAETHLLPLPLPLPRHPATHPPPSPRLTVPHCPSLPADSALLTGQHGNPRVSCGKSKNPEIHEGEITEGGGGGGGRGGVHSRRSFLYFQISFLNISQ